MSGATKLVPNGGSPERGTGTRRGLAGGRVRTEGHAASLEAAKADFQAQWEAFKVAGKDSDSGKG